MRFSGYSQFWLTLAPWKLRSVANFFWNIREFRLRCPITWVFKMCPTWVSRILRYSRGYLEYDAVIGSSLFANSAISWFEGNVWLCYTCTIFRPDHRYVFFSYGSTKNAPRHYLRTDFQIIHVFKFFIYIYQSQQTDNTYITAIDAALPTWFDNNRHHLKSDTEFVHFIQLKDGN